MPFNPPWRDSYVRGDLIFGYGSSITAFIDAHRGEGASDNAKVNAYSTDISMATMSARYVRGAEDFVGSLARHPKYGAVVSDEHKGIASGLQKAVAASGIRNPNREWRFKSKGALYWATREAGIHVHFVLDGIPMADVVGKNHPSPVAHARDTPAGRKGTPADEATKTRTVTHAELRWLYRQRNIVGVQGHIQFWLNNACCEPPWASVAGAALWQQYQPTTMAV